MNIQQNNLASALMQKLGNGTADADFARCVGEVVDAVQTTNKKGKLTLTIEVSPRQDLGCVEMRVDVAAKLPKLPAPASQMHVGPKGELLSQMEFLMGGGPTEAKPQPIKANPNQGSARLRVVEPAAPIAAAPALAPLVAVGKDAAAGKDT
jgi:hypothetical protein